MIRRWVPISTEPKTLVWEINMLERRVAYRSRLKTKSYMLVQPNKKGWKQMGKKYSRSFWDLLTQTGYETHFETSLKIRPIVITCTKQTNFRIRLPPKSKNTPQIRVFGMPVAVFMLSTHTYSQPAVITFNFVMPQYGQSWHIGCLCIPTTQVITYWVLETSFMDTQLKVSHVIAIRRE